MYEWIGGIGAIGVVLYVVWWGLFGRTSYEDAYKDPNHDDWRV